MFKQIHQQIMKLNDSRFFAGLIMIILNIGAKYVDLRLSKTQEAFLKYSLGRELLIFSVIWMGTKDLYLSLLMTAVFMILADYLFNEESRFCIAPSYFKSLRQYMDINDDGEITPKEIETAMDVLRKARKQREKERKVQAMNYFETFKL